PYTPLFRSDLRLALDPRHHLAEAVGANGKPRLFRGGIGGVGLSPKLLRRRRRLLPGRLRHLPRDSASDAPCKRPHERPSPGLRGAFPEPALSPAEPVRGTV